MKPTFSVYHQGIVDEVVTNDCYRLQQYFRAGDVLLDGGACFGAVSLLALSLGASRVVAVEPSDEALSAFRENLWTIPVQAQQHLVLEHAALAMGGGPRFFKPGDLGHGSLYGGGAVQVPVVSLWQVSNLLGPAPAGRRRWLKLDVEGAEREVLIDRETVCSFDVVTMEWHDHDGGLYGALLRAYGFKIWLHGGDRTPWNPTLAGGLLFATATKEG